MFLLIFIITFFILCLKLNIFLLINFSNQIIISIDFNIDLINSLFSLIVLIISLGVLFYRKFYFRFNISKSYKTNLIIFILSIIILINRRRIIILLIGWDGLGISSFFLVSFYINLNRIISSLITFFFNRLGDGFILIICSIILNETINIIIINFNLFIFILFFIGLITKSSQIPFGVWLPIAIAAPTPISSLVHSSTLVTAGIFVLIKIEFLFFIKEIQLIIINFSSITFILAGIFSVSILDFKKAVAFSTLSQIGFILFSLSIGNLIIAFYHLLFHAMFKSSIFVNLGVFINFNLSIQDRRILKIKNLNKIKNIFYNYSCINLIGLISTLGFLSKDLILISFISNLNKILIIAILYLGCVFTACYSIKFIILTFIDKFSFLKILKDMVFNFYFIKILIFFFL